MDKKDYLTSKFFWSVIIFCVSVLGIVIGLMLKLDPYGSPILQLLYGITSAALLAILAYFPRK